PLPKAWGIGLVSITSCQPDVPKSWSCRRRDQLDDRAIAAQRLTPPVDGDEQKRENARFCCTCWCGAANRNGTFELVGQSRPAGSATGLFTHGGDNDAACQ